MSMPTKFPNAKTESPFTSMRGDHAGIRVPDFDAAIAWYTEKLDFRVIHTWPYGDLKLAYVAPAVDSGFKIEILAGAGAAGRPSYKDLGDSLNLAGWHHICIGVDDADATVAELRRRGVTIVTEPFDLPVISRRLAFFADPWGNLFELTQVLA
ncbi:MULTISPECIES: VOC family protein [Rhodomicrobium]|uniref:VOC family protein n=1 Tax=Rhodomicrobium TaxID=1068 RepID=UPI001FDA255A|nr:MULTISPECIES: VOC family protein [Rhodomicrobium]